MAENEIEEDFEEGLDLDLGEETASAIPEAPRRGGRPPAKSPNNQLAPSPAAEARMKEQARQGEAAQAAQAAEQPQQQVIAVPRVVPMSTMVNEIYDVLQRHEQILMALLEAVEELKAKK